MTALVLRGVHGLRTRARDLLSVWTLIIAIPLAVALFDTANVTHILRTAAEAFSGTLPYIAGAVVLIALLKATGATALVSRAFEGRETRMIVLAALLGGLAPFVRGYPVHRGPACGRCPALGRHGVLARLASH